MDNFVRLAVRFSDRHESMMNAVLIASEAHSLISEIPEATQEQVLELLNSVYNTNKIIQADRVLSALEDVLQWSRKKVNMKSRRLRWLRWEGYHMAPWKGKTPSGKYVERIIRKRDGGIIFNVEHIIQILADSR